MSEETSTTETKRMMVSKSEKKRVRGLLTARRERAGRSTSQFIERGDKDYAQDGWGDVLIHPTMTSKGTARRVVRALDGKGTRAQGDALIPAAI